MELCWHLENQRGLLMTATSVGESMTSPSIHIHFAPSTPIQHHIDILALTLSHTTWHNHRVLNSSRCHAQMNHLSLLPHMPYLSPLRTPINRDILCSSTLLSPRQDQMLSLLSQRHEHLILCPFLTRSINTFIPTITAPRQIP